MLEASQHLQADIRKYDFYQLVELLHRLVEDDTESDEWQAQCRLIFSANPSLGFAPSDISQLHVDETGRCKLETTFLGLNGAQSPLPGFLLEQIASESELGLRRSFLDFFNNRLLSLVHKLWRKYRYYVRYQPDATDSFSAQVFSLVGMADQDLLAKSSLNKSKMLSYAGILAGRSRSPQVVAGVIAHYFDLEQVSIRQWEPRSVRVAPEQRFQLGVKNCEIGENVTLGSQVQDCMGKFVVEIKNLSYQRFNDFLPSGKEYEPFCKLVEFVLREQLAFDLELELKEEASTQRSIGDSHVSLGWSTFLGEPKGKRKVQIQVNL
nr:type VI secretion system baseplate subunit TssG [Vibrio marisflavi]